MIELYTAATGNGQRAAIALEECGLPYRARVLDLAKGEQRRPEFLMLNPRGMIPVVVDDGAPGGRRLVLTQSCAILLHYAEQTGRFLPEDPIERALALQWLMFAASDAAPTGGVVFALQHFVPEPQDSTTDFFNERLLAHVRYADRRLAEAEWLAGGALSVADLALFPVVNSRRAELAESGCYPLLMRWHARLAERPGVQRGLAASTR